MNDRLYRSVDDRVAAGVCGGIAARLAIDPSLVRVAFAVLTLLTGVFPFLVLYVIMAVVVPEEPSGFAGRSPTPPGPGAVPGWAPPTEGAGTAAQPWDETGTATPVAPAWPLVGPGDGTTGAQSGDGPPASWAAPAPGGTPDATRPRRGNDRMLGLIGGIVLVALGVWFLVRDRLDIDWGVVWAAGLMALGVVIVIAAIRPRR
jgi:phage shock protein C